MKKFSAILKQLRTDKKLSTKALGEAIGVSDTAVCNWENEVNDIKSEYIIKLAKFFKVSADYLLGLDDNFED